MQNTLSPANRENCMKRKQETKKEKQSVSDETPEHEA